MSRNPREPAKSGKAGAARWAEYLDWLREDVIEGVLALPEREHRQSRLPTGWTPLELLSHLRHMEQRWFIWGFLGEQVEEPWGDWNVPDPSACAAGARWMVPDFASAEDLARSLRQVGQRTRSILDSNPLDARGALGGRFVEDPPTLEWTCFHVLAEYARHAGQFDVVAEIAAVESRWSPPAQAAR